MLACGFQVSILLEVYCVNPARSNRGSQEWRMSGTNLINQCVGGNTKCHNWRTVWLSVSKGISKENMEVRHSRDVSTTVSREYLIWWMTGGQTGLREDSFVLLSSSESCIDGTHWLPLMVPLTVSQLCDHVIMMRVSYVPPYA